MTSQTGRTSRLAARRYGGVLALAHATRRSAAWRPRRSGAAPATIRRRPTTAAAAADTRRRSMTPPTAERSRRSVATGSTTSGGRRPALESDPRVAEAASQGFKPSNAQPAGHRGGTGQPAEPEPLIEALEATLALPAQDLQAQGDRAEAAQPASTMHRAATGAPGPAGTRRQLHRAAGSEHQTVGRGSLTGCSTTNC